MITVNALGKTCPEPVTMTKAALEKGAEELEVLVDNPISATNVKRFLEGREFQVLLQDDDGRLKLTASKKHHPPLPPLRLRRPPPRLRCLPRAETGWPS